MKKIFTLFFILVTFTSNAQTDCAPATITNVEREGTGNRITWKMPLGGKEVVISHSEEFINSAGDKSSFGVYHRFRPEDLLIVNMGDLKQVIFVPTFRAFQVQPGHSYTIQIYKGGIWGAEDNRSPGSLIAFQELENNNLIFHTENTITLETSVTIDASQELWIGYYCSNIDSVESIAKFPAGYDKGPCKDGLGNIMYYNNQWYTFCELSENSDLNWCIKGKVQTIDGLTVNIYHNNNPIDADISGTTYFHNNPEGDEHCYKVDVNCLEGGISPLSNEFCIKWNNINEPILKFNVFPNPASDELRVEWTSGQVDKIEIYDVHGRKLSSHHLITSSSNHKIDISSLCSGVYFIRIIDAQGSTVQSFIKN